MMKRVHLCLFVVFILAITCMNCCTSSKEESGETKVLDKNDAAQLIKKNEAALRSTAKTKIKIMARKAVDLGLRQSKFGGTPYFPKNAEYPKDKARNYLYLLAQFNMADLPPLANYPEKGILQFYIVEDYTNSLYFDRTEQNIGSDKVRVLYFPEVLNDDSKLVTDFSFLPKRKADVFVFEGEFALTFEKKEDAISFSDYRFNKLVGDTFLASIDGNLDLVKQGTGMDISGSGHKLGGYPYFTQFDPREHLAKKNGLYELLFQMDSQESKEDYDIIWGDVGVANFFIRESDLKNRDFSKILFNWDCS